ncbi:Hypp1876 [Branchiostoma lanceolatum]|uniref:Hypp1876 protein n=1 Tax=Branchiostoma lanceolatum TaxID=7740 RepID=A0A8J9ZNS2_BRALA|nr:Hypp1876 [Branchiostoma lanceolatum]
MSTIPDHIQREADRATGEATGDHLYDVTFIYHDKDLDFVVKAVKYIEQQQDLKIYYRRRDSVGPVLNNMVDSIQNSCITVATISQNFLEDTLRDYELQLAILTAVKKHGHGCLPVRLDNCKIPPALETIETYYRGTETGFEELSRLVEAHLCSARRGPCLPRTRCRGETAEPISVAAVQRQSCFPSPLPQSVDTQTLKGMIIHEVLYLFYLMVFHVKVVTRGLPEDTKNHAMKSTDMTISLVLPTFNIN